MDVVYYEDLICAYYRYIIFGLYCLYYVSYLPCFVTEINYWKQYICSVLFVYFLSSGGGGVSFQMLNNILIM